MRTEAIRAGSIEAAAERILDELKENTNTTRSNNVIYFDGWDGLGASAVLRAVAQRLAVPSDAPNGLKFDQIIQIDCSKWESRRALQRAIAEHLEIPASLMEMFVKQDEEDDFHGVAESLRVEIPQVLRAMYRRIQELNRRFLVILHNGSDEEIDLSSFGFPLSQYLDNKVLWTFQGRFRLKPRMKVDDVIKRTGKTDAFLSASSRYEKDPQKLWPFLVKQEAAEVVASLSNTSGIDQPSKVVDYFLYMLKLCCIGYHFNMDYDLATHSCNYWMCDAIVQQGQGNLVGTDEDDGPWQAANALQLAMQTDVSFYKYDPKYIFPSQLVRYGKSSTMTSEKETSTPYGFLVIPAGAIPNADMFHDFNKLSVLKVSNRSFSFSSPPFIYCHNLKFLWLDHCEDQDNGSIDGSPQQEDKTDGASTGDDIQHCFQRLWVLDVRYTCCDRILSARMLGFMTQLRELNVMGAQDWDIGQLQGLLLNIRKLRVTKSTICCSDNSENGLFSGMSKMELLDFSGNRTIQGLCLDGRGQGMTNLSGISTSNNCLETVMIVDGCAGIQKISFTGYANLKNLLLTGSFENLHILDISGTTVKILDLSTMTVPKFDELYLGDCKELCAILWSPKDKRKHYLKKLHIDTTRSAALLAPREEEKSMVVVHGVRVPSSVNWIVLVRDARLLRSFMPFKKKFSDAHVEISSPAAAIGSGKFNNEVNSSGIKKPEVVEKVEQPKGYSMLQETESNGDAPMQWPCPGYYGSSPSCYIHVQDHPVMRTKSLQEDKEITTDTAIPDIICDRVAILHVHHSLSISSIPGPAPGLGSRWSCLEWCRVQQCPKLECVFTAPQGRDSVVLFPSLKTFWASRLPKARCIWNWSSRSVLKSDFYRSFPNVEFLHVDLCPRLEHVLALPMPWLKKSSDWQYVFPRYLYCLQTLEIVWCSDLKEVFPVYTDAESNHQQQQQGRLPLLIFPCLRHIHLHELPMLQAFCKHWNMYAPNLKTVKIRGCWSLRRLPAVHHGLAEVKCDCEKEWWDRLEWDRTPTHNPGVYKADHSLYFKNNPLRGSVLT
ncbi:unnamed protein product [Urochloa decumbens]|uniref:Disease resistance protein At4g27190-like leucine-rich repeats domain-containing protein n=1 Tax=Urochloa decumbens TaxID=240449 RepID=A0ABC8W1F0_9POAL